MARMLYPDAGVLVFTAGEAERLVRSDSFTVLVQDERKQSAQIEKALIREIQNGIPSWKYTHDEATADVVVRYNAGYSICIDCSESYVLPQWARVEVRVRRGLARAEWVDSTSWSSRTRLVRLFVAALVKARNEQAA